MNFKMENPKDGIPVGDYVYETIKNNIINFNIKPGNRISEKEISELLNVSRTPVREAFIKLSKEGLLYVLPQRGTYISYIDLEEVEEARFIRESLERTVIKLAAENFSSELLTKLEENLKKQKEYIKEENYIQFLKFDEEFHKIIFQGCNKLGVWSIIQQINNQYKRIRLFSIMVHVNWNKIIEQHEEVIRAIKERDKIKAENIIADHLEKLLIEQVELREKYPEYFK